VTVTQADHKILRSQPQGVQGGNHHRNHLGIRRRTRLTEYVTIKLVERTRTPLLLTLVAEIIRNAEPLDRALQGVRLRPDHTGQGRRHLRTQSYLAATLILECEKLADDLVAGFFSKKIQWLQNGAIVLSKIKAIRSLPKDPEQMIANSTLFREEIPKSRKVLKHGESAKPVA